MCMCACVCCMCVGVCSQNCSRSQCECDLDPGLLLKSAGLQAKHCLSHQTQSNIHTHLIRIFHCLVRCVLLWPNVSKCDQAHRVHVSVCQWTNTSLFYCPMYHMSHPHAWVCSFIHFYMCVCMWRCHQVETLMQIQFAQKWVSFITSMPLTVQHPSTHTCTYTHTHSLHTQALIFIKYTVTEGFGWASKHTHTNTGAHTQIQKCLCVCFHSKSWLLKTYRTSAAQLAAIVSADKLCSLSFLA